MHRSRARPDTLAIGMVLLLTACGGGGSSNAAASRAAVSGNVLDRCALLTDDEIDAAIGPHGPGSSGLANEWALQSCRWTATLAQQVEGYPEWHDAIEVAVFEAAVVPMVRQQIRGDPVSGFVPGATYDHLYGETWFDCPHGRLCVVQATTRSGDRRQQIVAQLARLVESRLRAP